MVSNVTLMGIIGAFNEPFSFIEVNFYKNLSVKGKPGLSNSTGISPRTYSIVSPPFLLQSNLNGKWKLSIKN